MLSPSLISYIVSFFVILLNAFQLRMTNYIYLIEGCLEIENAFKKNKKRISLQL